MFKFNMLQRMAMVFLVIQLLFEPMMNVSFTGENFYSNSHLLFFFRSVPPAVNNLQVVRTSMTAARLVWEAPVFDGLDSLRGYQVFLSQSTHR